jgi:putative ABC transport system permease protein
MFNRDNWIEIFDTIRKNKLRTFLSGFTVALGIFIFIILFGFGNGLSNTFQKFFNDDNSNSMFLFPGRTDEPFKGYEIGRRIEFDNSDLKAIIDNFDKYIESISPRIYDYANIKYKHKSNNYSIRAVSPSHQYNEMTIMMQGRFLHEDDITNKKRHAVIGRLVALDLFEDENPIGKYIDASGHTWKVIGVFQDDGGDREERTVYIPYTSLQKIKKNTDKIDQIIINYKPEIGYAGAVEFEKKLKQFLKSRKDISPKDRSGIYIRNVADNLKQNQQFASVLQLIITFIGIGTLIAGIIGISNIMVFVVKERTKELGIRKAIGASPKSIITMILQESIFITTFSGYFGLIIGIATLSLIGDKLEEDYFITNPYIDISTAVTATIILILFGALAGYIPARRAAKIKPIIALRDE